MKSFQGFSQQVNSGFATFSDLSVPYSLLRSLTELPSENKKLCQGRIPFEVTHENISCRALAYRIFKRHDVRRRPSLCSETSRQNDRELQRRGGQYINLFVAKEFGIFEKHGLDVTLNQINSSSQAVAALRSKSVDVAMGPAGVIFDTIAIALVSLVTYIENRFCNW